MNVIALHRRCISYFHCLFPPRTTPNSRGVIGVPSAGLKINKSKTGIGWLNAFISWPRAVGLRASCPRVKTRGNIYPQPEPCRLPSGPASGIRHPVSSIWITTPSFVKHRATRFFRCLRPPLLQGGEILEITTLYFRRKPGKG